MFTIESHLWGSVPYHQVMVLKRYGKDLYECVLSKKYINIKTGLKINNIQTLFKQLAKTIKVVHDNNMIHKDIKCENILLRNVSQDITQDKLDIILIDYGVCINIESDKKNSDIPNNDVKFNHLCGTISYMTPEEIQGVPYNKSVDIFNIGLTIVEMYRGTYIFQHDVHQVLNAYLRIYPNFPNLYNPSLITAIMYKKIINNITINKFDLLPHDAYGIPYHKNYFVHGITDPDLVNLIHSCLDINPMTRITAKDILVHPFITKTL